jgi:hypothetical protein
MKVFHRLWVLLFTGMIYERILDTPPLCLATARLPFVLDWVVDIGDDPFVCRNRFGD